MIIPSDKTISNMNKKNLIKVINGLKEQLTAKPDLPSHGVSGKSFIKIIEHYGISHQLKHLAEEEFEFSEAVLDFEHKITSNRGHIIEEMADVLVMLKQFQFYYAITNEQLKEIINFKVKRQIERINKEVKGDDSETI